MNAGISIGVQMMQGFSKTALLIGQAHFRDGETAVKATTARLVVVRDAEASLGYEIITGCPMS